MDRITNYNNKYKVIRRKFVIECNIRSLLQCICLLGYCIFPIVLCALFLRILLPFLPGVFKILIVKICFFWSVKGYPIINIASVPFIAQNINEKKNKL